MSGNTVIPYSMCDNVVANCHIRAIFMNTYPSYVVVNGSTSFMPSQLNTIKKGSPYSIAERRVPELIPVLGSQPAGV